MEMNGLRRYILRRVVGGVPVLFGISLLAFILAQLSPGDPAEIMLEGAGMGIPSTEEIASLRSYLGLDAPPYVQYGIGGFCMETAVCPFIWGCLSLMHFSRVCP